jgi:hypothetical protein
MLVRTELLDALYPIPMFPLLSIAALLIHR